MSSRLKILEAIKKNQPDFIQLPEFSHLGKTNFDSLEKYKSVLDSIGGQAIEVANYQDIRIFIQKEFSSKNRIITTINELEDLSNNSWINSNSHDLQNVDFAVFKAHFGIAENGALWITEDLVMNRVAPFITQYLAFVINIKDIVATMHEAYDRISDSNYDYGVFIAGPSKTADIEQSLVLGAHGARGLTVFLMES